MKQLKPTLSIVIVAGKERKKDLLYGLKTIYQSSFTDFEIVLVDNSEDSTIPVAIRKQFPKVRVLVMPENTGIFAYNVGFANAQGEYILTLDDDCSLPKETLTNSIDRMRSKSSKVGALTANLFNPLDQKFGTQSYTDRKLVDVPIFCGASLFRAKVLREIGYFDASFFCWQHELDLSLRMLQAGYSIHYEQDFVVIHPKGIEFRPALHYYISRNETWLTIKHFSFPYFQLLLLKNLVVLLMLPFKYRNFKALLHGAHGYIDGFLHLGNAIKQRSVISSQIQRRFFRFHVLDKVD